MICPHCGKETMDTTTNLLAGACANPTVCNPTPNAPVVLNLAAVACNPLPVTYEVNLATGANNSKQANSNSN